MASKAAAFQEEQRRKKEEEDLKKAAADAEYKAARAAAAAAKKEAERAAAEAAQKAEEEKARKEAFKNRHKMFEKKEGPSEEEKIKTGIVKASQDRRFEKEMKKEMSSEEMRGFNPLAVELALRQKIGNSKVKVNAGDEYAVEGYGTASDVPEPPLPPVPSEGSSGDALGSLPSMLSVLPGVPLPAASAALPGQEEGSNPWEAQVVAPLAASAEAPAGADACENWQVVDDGSTPMPYYWNHVTGDTTYEKPLCLALRDNGGHDWVLIRSNPGVEGDVGYDYYWNLRTKESQYEVPSGFVDVNATAAVAASPAPAAGGEDVAHRAARLATKSFGVEVSTVTLWTEIGEGDNKHWQNTDTMEISQVKPVGSPLVCLEDGACFQQVDDGAGGHIWENSETGERRQDFEGVSSTMMICEHI